MKAVFSLALTTCLMIAAAALIFGTPSAFAESWGARSAGASAQAVAQDNTASPDATGSWQVSWTGRNGDQRQASMQITQKGSKLSGTFEGARGSVPVKGTLDGNQISLTVKLPRRQLSFAGTLDGDKMSGTTERGVTWSATRQ
ncbi:MAG TPA: hypothetical protein VME23_14225 [Terracidiphilus sp.]|nr:hypothetical protein [Terracidiphilus sp.]